MKYKGIEVKKSTNQVSWFARFRKNGKQHYVSAKTQLECYNKLKELYNQNKQPNEINNNIYLIDWYKQWLTLYKSHVRETTKDEYKNNLKYINSLLEKPINKITTIELLTIINKIPFERQKQKVYEFLNDLFKKATINEIIKSNPMLKIEKPKHKKEHVVPLEKQDEEKFIKYCQENNQDLFLVALYQGLRPGEVLALHFNDFNLEQNTLTINKSLDKKNEEGLTKNEYSIRTMPLLNQTKIIIEKYKNTKGRIFKQAKQTAGKHFNNIKKILFPESKYVFKSLRSTFITYCQENKVPKHIIQSWVGHVEGSLVTDQVYTHTRKDTELLYFNIINK
ncbi:MAG: site-specific integrase [Clostridia bacterium]|nr:site-specific integrase [Clostridia bacterium]